MYLWSYRQLAHDLREGNVSAQEQAKYFLLIMLYVPTGLMGSNWIPGFYRLIYRLFNDGLAIMAPDVQPLVIYHDYNYYIDLGVLIIVGIGTLFCYLTNRSGDNKQFIMRFMCLSVPITIQVSVLILFIFLCVLIGSLVWFYFKLEAISQIHGFFKGYKQLKLLKKLTPIMADISFRMHIFSSVMSLASLLWSFSILRRQIRYVSHTRPREDKIKYENKHVV